MRIRSSGWSGWLGGDVGAVALGCGCGFASGSGWRLGEFMCDGDDDYNCMERHDLHSGFMVSLLACPGELAHVRGLVTSESNK